LPKPAGPSSAAERLGVSGLDVPDAGAEACWAVERGRTSIPSVASLLADVDADSRVVLVPLDRPVLDISLTLAAITEMHDRQIAATALPLGRAGSPVPLLTCDTNITASGLVPIVW
jgi:hypothetical protein